MTHVVHIDLGLDDHLQGRVLKICHVMDSDASAASSMFRWLTRVLSSQIPAALFTVDLHQ